MSGTIMTPEDAADALISADEDAADACCSDKADYDRDECAWYMDQSGPGDS